MKSENKGISKHQGMLPLAAPHSPKQSVGTPRPCGERLWWLLSAPLTSSPRKASHGLLTRPTLLAPGLTKPELRLRLCSELETQLEKSVRHMRGPLRRPIYTTSVALLLPRPPWPVGCVGTSEREQVG